MDTGKYLIADYSIDCSSPSYTTFAVYSCINIFIYPVGIPLLYSVLLLANRSRIKQPVVEREKDENLAGWSSSSTTTSRSSGTSRSS